MLGGILLHGAYISSNSARKRNRFRLCTIYHSPSGGCRWPLDHRVHPRGTSGSHVTLIADIFTAETASHGAAGIFRPTTEKTPEKSLKQFRYEGVLCFFRHVQSLNAS
ncbi:hypothetical protein DPMN_177788 [Dreissena polymorpha]|uniref:Uncharacterized protein n=1 Tax=Dreissena polymorpha TaxID=45954 RepID=A0A9D4EBR1_DREPO|nr:hypothetical protein DPMN_177788 [Dreissena polymorpha]